VTCNRKLIQAATRASYHLLRDDAVNFKPADMSSALPRLDATYLPMVVMEAAACLDASCVNRKRIMDRCFGSSNQCAAGRGAPLQRLLMNGV